MRRGQAETIPIGTGRQLNSSDTTIETKLPVKITFKTGSDFNLSKLPPACNKMIESCRVMKDGIVIDVEELSAAIGVTATTISQFQSKAACQPYSFILKHKRWFANAATVQEAKRQYNLK